MVHSNRLAFVVLAFTAVAAAAVYAIHPEDANPVGITDIWSAREAELAKPIEDSPPLDRTLADVEAARRRSTEKHRLIDDLIEDRRSLADVAARFHLLDADRPDYATTLRQYGGEILEEQCCRAVIAFADADLLRDLRRDTVMSRLNAEMERLATERGQRADIPGS